jgi:hypothetical protein
MPQRIQFSFNHRPTWQRYLIVLGTLIVTAFLFWIGLIFVFAFAVLAMLVAAVNYIKFKITGRPLFKGPQHFHRYQSQFGEQFKKQPKGAVIEGEVIKPGKETD